MKITICDRCGKQIKGHPSFTIEAGRVLTKVYEVCDDCRHAFDCFMQEEKETETEKC